MPGIRNQMFCKLLLNCELFLVLLYLRPRKKFDRNDRGIVPEEIEIIESRIIFPQSFIAFVKADFFLFFIPKNL